MHRADLLTCVAWDVDKFKRLARSRVVGFSGSKELKENQLPFRDDGEAGWTEYVPFHAFLLAVLDELVNGRMDRSLAADLLRGPFFQIDIRQQWKSFVSSSDDYWIGLAHLKDPSSSASWDEVKIFKPWGAINLPKRAEFVALANASKAWRDVCNRARLNDINIEKVFG